MAAPFPLQDPVFPAGSFGLGAPCPRPHIVSLEYPRPELALRKLPHSRAGSG